MLLRIARAFLSALLFALIIVTAWMVRELYHPFREVGERAEFELDKGRGAGSIIRSLKTEGIVRSPLALTLAYRLFFSDESLKAGEYRFEFPETGKNVLLKTFSGAILLHPLTIPEGLTGTEIGDLLQGQIQPGETSFLEAFSRTDLVVGWDPLARNLEGYLYPDTYHLPADTTEEELVQTMVTQFQKLFTRKWRKRAEELGMSVREIVILASLIEKETARTEERALVSAVFHNRLRLGMKLDCDPTILYALKLEGRTVKRLLYKDLKNPSPYNTYLHQGLPPGPICNPGHQALEAALFPAQTDYLYFVSQNDGSHHFSKTFREHQEAVRRYQLKK